MNGNKPITSNGIVANLALYRLHWYHKAFLR